MLQVVDGHGEKQKDKEGEEEEDGEKEEKEQEKEEEEHEEEQEKEDGERIQPQKLERILWFLQQFQNYSRNVQDGGRRRRYGY